MMINAKEASVVLVIRSFNSCTTLQSDFFPEIEREKYVQKNRRKKNKPMRRILVQNERYLRWMAYCIQQQPKKKRWKCRKTSMRMKVARKKSVYSISNIRCMDWRSGPCVTAWNVSPKWPIESFGLKNFSNQLLVKLVCVYCMCVYMCVAVVVVTAYATIAWWWLVRETMADILQTLNARPAFKNTNAT